MVAGIVDQHVDPAGLLDHVCDRRIHRSLRLHVELDRAQVRIMRIGETRHRLDLRPVAA